MNKMIRMVNKMAKGSARPRKEITILAVAALLLLFALAIAVLQFNNLRDLRALVEEEEMAVMQARATFNQRLEHRENAAEYEERIRVLQLLVPQAPREDQVLSYFDFLSAKYDLDVQQISFGEREENEEAGYTRMPLSITIEGRYQNLADFLAHLYDGERAVRVDNVSISLAETPEERANIRVSISAGTFYSSN